MLTFENYTYERPDIEKVKTEFEGLLYNFSNADSLEKATEAIESINKLRNRLSTMSMLVFIRASIDTNDEFYKKEQDFFDDAEPEIQEISAAFYKELVTSPYRKELKNKWGAQLFNIADF